MTYFGKGRMPVSFLLNFTFFLQVVYLVINVRELPYDFLQGFGENCTPRGQCTFGARLQTEEIKLLAEFVKSQADQGWPKIESMEE